MSQLARQEKGEQTPDAPAVQLIQLTKHYDARVRKITSAIEFRNFVSLIRGKNSRTVTALNGVDLSVAPGEVFGLLGPNGAGKTTMIKILSTLVLPDSGQALVQGMDVTKHPRKVLRTLQAVLAEGWGFERRLSGRQNLEFYATLYGIPKSVAIKRIDDLLEFCQLQNAADEMFQKYSTGMTRKLLVSRALLTDASVLLFDEPTSGLDPVSAADLRSFLKNVLVREKGKTLIWATHNLFEAQLICDTIGVLNKGKIVARGTPTEIRKSIAERVAMTISVIPGKAESQKDALDALRKTSGVTHMNARLDLDTSNLILDLETTRDVDYNAIFGTLSAFHLKIVSLEASQPSLEEAFIKLTRGGQT